MDTIKHVLSLKHFQHQDACFNFKAIILYTVLVSKKSEMGVLGKYMSELKKSKNCPLCRRGFPEKHGCEELIKEVNTTDHNYSFKK